MRIIGFDIGGTKCAVLVADVDGEKVEFLFREEIQTKGKWQDILNSLCSILEKKLLEFNIPQESMLCAGVSCGGPLDSKNGIIYSPPNLPGWDAVPIVSYLQEKLKIPVALMNDADAGAVAEWKFGAGRGAENMIFLTFGTGLGAGLILNGRLYSGTNNMAGEIGHVRLRSKGPLGYGKYGSMEGFCSGGGLKQIAQKYARKTLLKGGRVSFCADFDKLEDIDAKAVIQAADRGEKDAQKILRECGKNFGRCLSILIDILNPEVIVAGSIFCRAHKFIYKPAIDMIKKEALAVSAVVCHIEKSQLGERIGDYAAIVAAPMINK